MCQYDKIFLSQLNHHNSDDSDLTIPEGLSDFSSCIQPLFAITDEGRPFDSSETGFLPEFFSKVFAGTECVITQYIFQSMMIHGMHIAPPHSLSEEVFTKTFSQAKIRRLSQQWRATPYVLDDEGNIIPLFLSHEVFTRSHAPREEQMKGFNVRHWLPTLESLFTVNEDLAEWLVDDVTNKNIWISEEELAGMNLEADPYNGYDEMFRHFNQNVVQPTEEGESLTDIGYGDNEIDWFKDPDENSNE
jgi:hypothetical protein